MFFEPPDRPLPGEVRHRYRKSTPLWIGDCYFPSKTAARCAIRKIYYDYRPGETVQGEDFYFLAALIQRHPRATQKIGCGLATFRIEVDEMSSTAKRRNHLCVLVRVDGTETDFSYKKCLTPESLRSVFLDACRTVVVSQIQAFRTRQFGELRNAQVACALTGALVSWDDAHIDHEPRFEQLVIDFLREVGWDYQTIPLAG